MYIILTKGRQSSRSM